MTTGAKENKNPITSAKLLWQTNSKFRLIAIVFGVSACMYTFFGGNNHNTPSVNLSSSSMLSPDNGSTPAIKPSMTTAVDNSSVVNGILAGFGAKTGPNPNVDTKVDISGGNGVVNAAPVTPTVVDEADTTKVMSSDISTPNLQPKKQLDINNIVVKKAKTN